VRRTPTRTEFLYPLRKLQNVRSSIRSFLNATEELELIGAVKELKVGEPAACHDDMMQAQT
jgi:hypothetical protein